MTLYRKAVENYRRDELDKRVLSAIRQYIAENDCSPSIRDICAIVGRSVGSVHKALVRLEKDGAIKRKAGKACSIKVVSDVRA